jgi:hypothetical protein
VNVARIRTVLALLAVALGIGAPRPSAAASVSLSGGLASLSLERARGPRDETGVALSLRLEERFAPQIRAGLGFTWGLTDWDRARDWIEAGNRAGRWTTDRLAAVEAWATRKDVREDRRGLRYLGLVFADLFLVMTYAAVPFCYAGSLGGATSFLQLDATATFHLAPPGGPADGWLEVGAGSAAILYRFDEGRGATGPVLGAGMRLGLLRIAGRALWSPPGLNRAVFGGPIVAASLTAGVAY